MLIFDPHTDIATTRDGVVVNTVNTVGVMGAGVAKAVRERWPSVMAPNKRACENGRLEPGALHVHRLENGQTVINMATKRHWRDPSEYAWVGSGLLFLSHLVMSWNARAPNSVTSITLPPPGCGHGGLDWNVVEGMVRAYLQPVIASGVRVTATRDPGEICPRPVFYAGVGSRRTPDDVLDVMKGVAERLERMGFVLRSGGAIGADSAFEAGLSRPEQSSEIYLAKPRAGGANDRLDIDPVFTRIAKAFHPAPYALRPHALKLMARNGCQVFGSDFTMPSDALICWTKEGRGEGGTGQAIRLARAAGIPILDLGGFENRGMTADDVTSVVTGMIARRREAIGLPQPDPMPEMEPATP